MIQSKERTDRRGYGPRKLVPAERGIRPAEGSFAVRIGKEGGGAGLGTREGADNLVLLQACGSPDCQLGIKPPQRRRELSAQPAVPGSGERLVLASAMEEHWMWSPQTWAASIRSSRSTSRAWHSPGHVAALSTYLFSE